MFTFNHTGSLGDILFSLYFCKEMTEANGEKQFNLHIQTTSEEKTKIEKLREGFSNEDVQFILPLLQKQKYINKITFDSKMDERYFNLQNIRRIRINEWAGDIRGWYYNLTSEHLPREFWKPIIQVEPNYKFKDKIIFNYTQRYINLNIDYNLLKPYKDKLVFFGLKSEYQIFKEKYFDMQYVKVNNMLEAAQYIAGAKGFLGNQSGMYTIAECLKTPRILLSPQWIKYIHNQIMRGPFNNNPIGGWNEVASINEKMIHSINKLLDNKKTAIVLIAYNRFDIINKVVEALNKNKHYDLIVNFDNHNDIQNYNKMKEKILKYFPNAIVKMRPKRLGPNVNTIGSIQEAFYNYHYERIFLIEEDVYTDPTCLETLENLMNWTDKNLPNLVGMVQGWNNNLTNEEYIKLHELQDLDYSKTCTYAQNEIGFTGQNFWGALISKKCWDIINPYINSHLTPLLQEHIFNVENYQDLVCKLLKSKASDFVRYRVINRFAPNSWESIIDLSMAANNLFKITLTNPRSKTIGVEGATSSSEMFSATNLNKIQTLNSPNVPTQFILNQQSKKLWLKE